MDAAEKAKLDNLCSVGGPKLTYYDLMNQNEQFHQLETQVTVTRLFIFNYLLDSHAVKILNFVVA